MAVLVRFNFKFSALIAVFMLSFLFSKPVFSQNRREYVLEHNWKFSKGDISGAEQVNFNDKGWESVSIPHDWAIKGPFDVNNDIQDVKIAENNEAGKSVKSGRTGGLPFVGVGWYRTQLSAKVFKKGQRAVLLFDGAMSYPKVFINGQEAGHWAYGYTSFSIDITAFLKPGEDNTLAVRLENLPEASRWYPGAGLYRNVHLIVTDDVHIPVWGTYITTPEVNPAFAKVNVKTRIENHTVSTASLHLETVIRDAKGTVVSSTTSALAETDESQF